MNGNIGCRFCGRELEPARALAYLVESATDDPAMLAAIRTLPHHHGKPLRVCRGCQTGLEHNRLQLVDVLADGRRVGRRGGQFLLLGLVMLVGVALTGGRR